jgi:N-acetyl-gamma-glutamyl-phosphate reductase
MLAGLDAIAVALPSEASALWVPLLLELGVPRVLDLSDHYRGVEGVHYGLPELFGAPPANARLVANPGCYPTAALLPLVPLLRAKLVDSEGIAVVGASGASGAGKGLAEHLHFCNLAENVFPYKVGTHRHVPEIERHATIGARSSTATGALSDRPPDAPRDDGSGPDVSINFVTQLLPIVRGMLVTTFVRTEHEPAALLDTLHAAYEDAPWISVVDHPDQNLGVRHVVGTHQAVIGVGPARRSGIVPLFCSIDNLMRGASSQALHNLNLWLGLPPGTGLPSPSPPPTGVPVAYAAAARSTDRDAFT